jgi:hypothetical protein
MNAMKQKKVITPPVEIDQIRSMASRDACIVEITAVLDGALVISQGTSKRTTGDRPDERTAYLLAMSRALQSLASKVGRRATASVDHNDSIARMRPIQKARSAVWHETHNEIGAGELTQSIMNQMDNNHSEAALSTRLSQLRTDRQGDCC